MTKEAAKGDCFVIMPISDPKDYENGHFKRVYEDIIKPACASAGFNAIRADEIEETDMIHVSILKRIIEAPMSICDLSTRNPNVLFELGLRQAFDKPVVLIQENDTPRIFDVSILRAYEYSRDLKYHKVLENQAAITKILEGTEKAFVTGTGTNSITKLLAISGAAKIEPVNDPTEKVNVLIQSMQVQIENLTYEIRNLYNDRKTNKERIISSRNMFRMEEKSYYNMFMKAYELKDFEGMKMIINKMENIHKYENNSQMLREMMNMYNNCTHSENDNKKLN